MSYQVFKETMCNEFIGKYISYGIKYDGQLEIHDISLDFDRITSFVNDLNHYKVDPTEVEPMIEDFVCEC